jgi:hypothetical protein
VFDDLKARLDRFLADHTPAADRRSQAAQLQSAIIQAKVAVAEMKEGVERTSRELAAERRQLEDAERRGQMASNIQDQETARVAESFVARHRERIGVLERKLGVQQEELGLAERDLGSMTAQFRQAKLGTDLGLTEAQQAAWRDIESAGGVRPETDVEQELLKARMDQARRDAAVEAQLAHLKKKLGKSET